MKESRRELNNRHSLSILIRGQSKFSRKSRSRYETSINLRDLTEMETLTILFFTFLKHYLKPPQEGDEECSTNYNRWN